MVSPEQAEMLREPFPPEAIGKLPKAGTTLDYVGHAAVTDRLLRVDPEWTWEPVAWAIDGTPLWTADSGDAVMWIKLTVAGVTRYGVGICKSSAFELEKQLISDALRNAAMRFGVALDLWSKEDLGAHENATAEERSDAVAPPSAVGGRGARRAATDRAPKKPADAKPAPAVAPVAPSPQGAHAESGSPPDPDSAPFVVGQATLDNLHSRCSALQAANVDIRAARVEAELPPLANIENDDQLHGWGHLLTSLEKVANWQAVS